MIAAFIIAAEIGFWMLLLSGLAVRYLLRRPRLGAALLLATPLVDVALLAATVVDLRNGATASIAHALAAVYIGVSVAYGHSLVRWADVRFAHRFAGGSPPAPGPRSGRPHAARERRGWLRHALAWSVGAGLLLGGAAAVGDADRTQALVSVAGVWSLVVAVDFVISFSYTLFPRRPAADAPGR